MKKLATSLFLSLLSLSVWGSGGHALFSMDVDLGDKASLQRGARLFVNYCLSCHSASFMRYNRMARDLGIGEEQLIENLMFTTDKPGELMEVAMKPADAERWFGVAPPDLSVISRARGANWIYSFLLTFYKDDNPDRPFGVNNLQFDRTAMPPVLMGLQGVQVLQPASDSSEHDRRASVTNRLHLQTPGSMNPAQYRKSVKDLVNFLVYMGEPAKLVRYSLGFWVLVFITFLFILSRALYKEYWKDIH